MEPDRTTPVDEAGALADLAATLLAIDPVGLGGAVVTGSSHEAAREWSRRLRARVGPDAPLRRLPPSTSDDRLLGGLDLAASLSQGRRVVMRGVLAEADGGVLVVPLAERLPSGAIVALADALDHGQVTVERDGVADRHEARLVVVALDEEGEGPDDVRVAPALDDRLAFRLAMPVRWPAGEDAAVASRAAAARSLLSRVGVGRAVTDIAHLQDGLGVPSMRAGLQALRTARAHAALAGRTLIADDDVMVAARLVLAPRATRIPSPPEAPPDAEAPPPPADDAATEGGEPQPQDEGLPNDMLLEAVRAMLPADLLDPGAAQRRKAMQAGRRGQERQGGERGRQDRAVPGVPGGGKRLDPIATVRTAAPWQPVRRRERPTGPDGLRISRDDFRLRHFRRRAGTTTILAVDASGSMALQRLAEAKGAVELLLARSYVRRDRVALVAFRGDRAAVLVPPTRALARARRAIVSLPGGGGTPLASAVEVVHALALSSMREGRDVVAVFLTDGKANIARDGSPGRERAMADALAAARLLRASPASTIVVDTSPRGEPRAREFAEACGARYVPLPSAAARDVATLVTREQGSGVARA